MPLGKLSKTQIAKGFEVLEEIEEVLKSTGANKSTKINDLSSKFYTVIPQDFGRTVPPAINTQELLQKKYDMLVVLSDIELAQSMQEKAEKDSNAKDSKVKIVLFVYFNLIIFKNRICLIFL
jgi:poly [ADP-ribose] polymerase 2/3/4